MFKRSLSFVFVFVLLFGGMIPVDAQSTKAKKKWDVLNPPFELNTLEIDTDETTWSSLDITPDGKSFVFDMLGDIYTVDIEGGTAKALTQDFAWNLHPAVSPDGSRVAFVSDRDGLTNVWTMKIDGTDLKQISKERKNIMHSPKWSPDGEYIVAHKGIMSRRSIPAGEMWLYHKTGGSGIQVRKRRNGPADQKNMADPAFSPDGRYLYFTQDITPGRTFSYNRDPLTSIFAIPRYDLKEGREERFISGMGGAIVPTPSPDGKRIAFVRRIRNKTALFLKDLDTGIERPIYRDLERDMQEGFGSEGYFAYFDWTPDSKDIVFWTGGKFHRLSVDKGTVKTIPVRVKATLKYNDALRFPIEVSPDKFDIKMTRWAQKSPDGKSVIFQALGKLYTKNLSSGEVKRVTSQNEHDEFYPRYSNDGKSIVYTTWNDQKLGSVRVMNSDGSNSRVITKKPGHFVEPDFSTDGKMVVYRKFSGGFLLDSKYSQEPGIYVANLDKRKSQESFERRIKRAFRR